MRKYFVRISRPEENLLNSFACYLFTSSGSVMGTLYLSTAKVAFCSDSPLSYKVGEDTQWSYYKLSKVEVWLQQPKDIVQNLVSGDLDLGFVGLETVCEYGQGNEDLLHVHHIHGYDDCRLSLAIPKYSIFVNINSLKEIAEMPHWTPERPLRVASGFTYLGPKFLKENGLKHVAFSVPDGFLEAAPRMGIADAIMDLVSCGTTLRDYNLKEIDGGVLLEIQAVLVASRKSLIKRKGVLEMIEGLEARLRAVGQVTADMRASGSHSMWQISANISGGSEKDVAERINSLSVLQGTKINPVFCERGGEVFVDYYTIIIFIPKDDLIKFLKRLHEIGGSAIYVHPFPYAYDEESIFEMAKKLKELRL